MFIIKKLTKLTIILIMVVSSSFFCASCGFFSDSPKDVAVKYFEALSDQDFDEAYDYMYVDLLPEYQESNKEMFKQMMSHHGFGRSIKIKDIDVLKEEERGNKAAVLLKLKGPQGAIQTSVYLVKINGKWKIVSME